MIKKQPYIRSLNGRVKLSRYKIRVIALSLFCIIGLTATVVSQTIKVDVKNTPISTILDQIKKQSGLSLFYSSEDIDTHKRVNFNFIGKEADAALKQLLGLDYVITHSGHQALSIAYQPQPKKKTTRISGAIQDRSGQPIEGVTLQLSNKSMGAFTGRDGQFSLSSMPGDELSISFVGMQRQVIEIPTQDTTILVIMQPSNLTVSDVVVTGYQELQRKQVVGSISSLSPSSLTQLGAVSVDQMLQGRIPGMTVTGIIGNPGAPPKIRIRGTSSITGDQEPIWVVDGVIWEDPIPIRNRDLATADDLTLLNMVGSSIAGLNPNDIESIDVLKDASATAIYGVRAVNGVIVVTTKQGKTGKTRVNYSADVQIRARPNYGQVDVMNAAQRLRTSEELFAANILSTTRSNKIGWEGAYLDYTAKNISKEEFDQRLQNMATMNTNWFDELFTNSWSQNHNLSLSGGSQRTTYLFSGSIYDEKANAKGSGLTRYAATMRLGNQITDRLYTDLKVGINIRDNKGFHKSINPYTYAINTSRAIPAYDSNGLPFFYDMGAPQNGGWLNYNIFNELSTTGSTLKAKELQAQLNLRYSILKNLRFESLLAYNTTTSRNEMWAEERSHYISYIRGYQYGAFSPSTSQFDRSPLQMGGILETNRMDQSSYTVRNQLFYDKEFTGEHRLTVLAGNEIRSVGYYGDEQKLHGYFHDRGGLIVNLENKQAEKNKYNFTNRRNNYLSYYGIADYRYANRYIANFSARYDGSNLFGKNSRFRYSPIWSAGAKWIISEENFLQDSKLLSHLAVRMSYGWQGNIRSDASPSLVAEQNNVDPLTGKYYSSIRYFPNPDLRWEKSATLNAGLEIGLFNNRINIAADYYNKKGKDLLIDQIVSYTNGRNTVLVNGGDMYNRGIELSLSAYVLRNQQFSWHTTLTGANNRNRITLANVEESSRQNRYNGRAVIQGDAYGSLYSYSFMGLNEKGWPTFLNEDGTQAHMSTLDQAILLNSGSINPDLSGGWHNTFRYKNITLDLAMAFNFGSVKRLPKYYPSESIAFPFDVVQNFPAEYINRWKQPGDEQFSNLPVLMDVLALTQGKNSPHNFPTPNGFVYATSTQAALHMHEMYNNSDLRVIKADYVRLQAINVHYDMPQKWVARTPVKSLRIRLSAQNIAFWAADKDRLSGRDPEIIDQPDALPIPRIYSFGINAGF